MMKPIRRIPQPIPRREKTAERVWTLDHAIRTARADKPSSITGLKIITDRPSSY